MSLKELESQLLALTPTEKAEAIHVLTRSISNGLQGML